MLTCPLHREQGLTVVQRKGGSTNILRAADIREERGGPVEAGRPIHKGTILFADGSRITTRTKHTAVTVIDSFWEDDGRLYTLVYLDSEKDKYKTIQAKVTPGSRFEAITPAVIAGVRGTEFILEAHEDDDVWSSTIEVLSGAVSTRALDSGKTVLLGAGRSQTLVRRKPRG